MAPIPSAKSVGSERKPKVKIINHVLKERIRKKMQAHQTMSRHSAMVHASSDAMISMGLAGLIESWNPAAESMMGWTADEAIGMPAGIMMAEDYLSEWTDILGKSMSGEHQSDIEMAMRTKEAKRLRVSVSISPLRDAYGNVNGTCCIIRDLSKRSATEAQDQRLHKRMQTLEGQLEEVIKQMPVGIAILDMNGNLIARNRKQEQILGSLATAKTRGEYEKIESYHTDGTRYTLDTAPQTRSIKTGEVISQEEIRIRKLHGEDLWLSVSSAPLRDRSGEIVGAVISNLDITKRKQVEQELTLSGKRSEEQLRLIINSLPVLIAYVDRNQRYRYTNRTYEEWLDVSGQDVAGKHVSHVIGASAYQIIQPHILKALQGKTVHYETEIRYGSGKERYISATYLPHSIDGQVEGYIALVEDATARMKIQQELTRLNQQLERRVSERTAELEREIAERKNVEQQDRANLTRLQAIIESLPMATIASDEDRKILHVNSEFCRMLGIPRSPASLIGASGFEMVRAFIAQCDDPMITTEFIEEIVNAGKPVLGHEVRLKTGRILSCDFIPIFVGRKRCGQLYILRDVTNDRKIDAAKSEFMSLASHQLRTPLTAIRWALSRLNRSLETRTDESDRKLLSESRNAATRMANTIDTMLAISRIEAGKVNLRFGEVKMREFFEKLKESFADNCAAHGQQMVIQCPEELTLMTDGSFLAEILSNLISNAGKYTPAGGTITLLAQASKEDIVCEVRDTGFGIPLHQQSRVFSKFFRADNIVGSDPNGTGLGLYLVYLLVNMLGGSISFSSVEQAGTTFTLRFPLTIKVP